MISGALTRAAVRTVLPAAALPQAGPPALDTVVVESPLPGGVAEVSRFLLNNVASWVQLTGLVLGVVAAVAVAVLVVRARARITAWIGAQSRPGKIALGAVAFAVIASAASVGAVTWDYTQHDNAFCTGCHVMNPAFHRFSNAENKHAELSCHDCHQQSLYASARQLYLWVAERPAEIGEHAKVPNRVCETCHVTADTARWQRVASTAGHRVHFESDSSALDNLQCVTCHGVEVHQFKPVSETCGQSGCHSTDDTRVVLGRMAGQTVRHCTSCHGFVAEVPALATTDSARGTLVPGGAQCLGCHEMRAVLRDFDANLDPHGGKCGSCHNPHTQTTPAQAANSCASAGCHDTWRDEPFHSGVNHRRVGERCLTCHVPHRAKVDASDCQGCHEAVRARGALRPPVRFDTSAVLRRDRGGEPHAQAPTLRPDPGGGQGDAESDRPHGPYVPDSATPEIRDSGVRLYQAAAAAPARQQAARADSFPHARHDGIACLVCHETGTGHGQLTFERPRGCAICHHQSPSEARCERCHRPAQYGQPIARAVTISVPGHAPRPRDVPFVHERHASRTCTECHSTPVTLEPAPAKAQCRDCHTEHHAVERSCASCHRVTEPAVAHTSPEIAHRRCDACHTAAIIAQLTPTREFCATCHAVKRTDHYEPRECTTCHFLADPATYRAHLSGSGR